VQVSLGNDLHQGHPGPVKVNQAHAFNVHQPGRILLKVHAPDPKAFGGALHLYLKISIRTEGQVVLTDLVSLGKVRIVIVLAVELAECRYGAIEGHASEQSGLHGDAVHHRQHARHAQADWAGMRVGCCGGQLVHATTEHLGSRQDFGMNLHANGGLILHGSPHP